MLKRACPTRKYGVKRKKTLGFFVVVRSGGTCRNGNTDWRIEAISHFLKRIESIPCCWANVNRLDENHKRPVVA